MTLFYTRTLKRRSGSYLTLKLKRKVQNSLSKTLVIMISLLLTAQPDSHVF